MTVTVEQVLATLSLEEASLATVSGALVLILRDPQPNDSAAPIGSTVGVRVVDLEADPALGSWGRVVTVQIDQGAGWETAYSTASGFGAAWNGADSAVSSHASSDPYAYIDIVCDQTGAGMFDGEETVQVRVVCEGGGFGHASFGHYPFGSPPAAAELDETWSFVTEDTTSPRLLSAEAIDQVTVRATFDDAMTGTSPDGRAAANTSGTETWDLSSGGETLTVKVDGGTEQTVTFAVDMWLDPSAVTAAELAYNLSALVSGGVAEETVSGAVSLLSETVGDDSSIQITGGTANTELSFPTTLQTGSFTGAAEAANYTFTRQNVYPAVAVNLEAVSVAFVDGSGQTQVDITVDWPMTPDAPYQLTVDSDLTDTSENTIDGDYLTASFSGFVPDWPALRSTEIKLPQTIWDRDYQQVARALLNIFQEAEDLTVTTIDQFLEQLDPDRMVESIIDLALYGMGNPFTRAELDLTAHEKKKLLDLLPVLYQYKGLGVGIEAAIQLLLGLDVQVVPWVSDGWRLGEDYLGDTFPAEVVAGNAETYNLTGGGTLTVSIDGGSDQTVTFVDGDFDTPSAALAEEVAAVIVAQLVGGSAAETDPGTGAAVTITSTLWGPEASVQVTGGTANSALGFDTTKHHGGGGCLLAPSTSRAIRTFDIEVQSSVTSTQESIICWIATYMKAVNEHVGEIRTARTVPTSDEWSLGDSRLGEGTILGE